MVILSINIPGVGKETPFSENVDNGDNMETSPGKPFSESFREMRISTKILLRQFGDDVEKSGTLLPGNQRMPNFVDISGPHGYHQIILLAILQKIVFNFFKGVQAQAGMPERFDLLCQGMGTDPEGVGLSGGVYFGKDDVVSQRQGSRKIVHQSLGPRVSVGLEHAPELPVGIVLRSPEGGLDLCGMMSVVVDDGKAVSGAQNLEASFRTNIFTQRSRCVCAVDAEAVSRCGSRHGIVDVVLAGDAQRDSLPVDSSVRAAGRLPIS